MTNTIDIIQEVEQNFIDSSYDVNTNRAFPDVRDGLKPGQRACIWEMYTKGFTSNKPHVKSAKIDGGVAALWWPHGTTAIYETFARMSQPFTNNVPEVDFHGANGNIILGGDALAADRYTEARLAKITEEGMLKGINKNNVPMIWNFSEDEQWPKVLPAIFPRLLVNGAQGIGVSLANYWCCHNFTETANLILDYLSSGELKSDEYYPDFPTGGTIVNKDELSEINRTGKGRILLEANYIVDGQEITFYEMPYQVYIEPVIEKIKDQIEKEELTGVKEVLNKSDKNRIALVVTCNLGTNPEEVVQQLFEQTTLRSQYNINQNGIVSKTPVLLNLQQVIDVYIQHNSECIRREFEYDYKKTQDRVEILEGLITALAHIDDIIQIIRFSSNAVEAKKTLIEKYTFTDNQAKAILDMKLARLTKLDGAEIDSELKNKKEYAEKCAAIVQSENEQKNVLYERLEDLVKKFGDKRRTKVIQKEVTKSIKTTSGKKEKAIESVVVTYNPLGYVQRIPLAQYKNNGYKSIKTTTGSLILLFSNLGKFYRISPTDAKMCGVKDKGTAFGAIVKLEPNEKIVDIFSDELDEEKPYLIFATNNGIIKKIEKQEYFGKTRNLNGMIAIKTKVGQQVISVQESNGNDIVLRTENNMAIRFHAEDVRAQGKNSAGVKGISLSGTDEVKEMIICNKDSDKVLLSDGYISISAQGRGGKGKKVR